MGYSMNVGPELEFYLFEKKNGGSATIPHDFGGYFDLGPVDLAEDVRKGDCKIPDRDGLYYRSVAP